MLAATLPPSVSSLSISLTPFLIVLLMPLYEVVYATGHEADAVLVQRRPVSQSAGGRVLSGAIRAALAPTLLSLTHRGLLADAQGGAVWFQTKGMLQINKICLACLPTPDGAV